MKKFIRLALILAVIAVFAGCSSAEITKIDDLKASKVGVQNASVGESLIREMLKDSQDNILVYEDVSALIEALKAGQVDAVVMDESPARFFTENEQTVKILPETLYSSYYGIAVKKGNQELLKSVNKALVEIKEEGTLAAIISKYIHVEEPDPAAIDFNQGAKGGKLWVGCAAAFPPYEVRTIKGFSGIDVELCAAIAKKLDKELIMVDYRFGVLPEALESGRIDMICSALVMTEERAAVMDFSDPYDADQQVVLILAK